MSQPRDYRRMLYRLDRATQYESVPALVQHMMDETVLDGILELRMITSTSSAGSSGEPTELRLPSTFISFRRDGMDAREVNAVALYGPRSSGTPPTSPPPNHPSAGRPIPNPNDFTLEVKKRFAPRTTLVWVFSPLVQRLLNEGASTVLFECRSYLAGSDVAREISAADAEAAAAAAAQREEQYQYPQPTATQPNYNQNQNQMYDPNAYQWQQDVYSTQFAGHNPAAIAPSAWNPNATYPLTNATYVDAYVNQIIQMSEQQSYLRREPTGYQSQPNNNPPPSAHPQRPSGGSSARARKTTPPAPRPAKDEDPALELLNRRAPFKRMLGYAGKQHDGSVAVYELADEVAAIAFNDGVSGIGMAGVRAMGTIGRGRRASPPTSHTTPGAGPSRRP
ncbi:hypothetical protein OPQ81_008241 [Rhizoctonia solani]|nr:hypothetical protein OPQ81_008241 [Rhizoctonia solani]